MSLSEEGQVPRQSAAATALVFAGNVSGQPERIRPPVELAAPAREVFVGLVAATKPGHFQEIDIPLLAAYCRAVVMEREASAAISKAPAAAPPPLLKVHAQAVRALYLLSQRLRLSPQSRQPNVSRGSATKPASAMSAYERMALERDQ
jgi:phage terminase small subunit